MGDANEGKTTRAIERWRSGILSNWQVHWKP
jgi:hypothetical protein